MSRPSVPRATWLVALGPALLAAGWPSAAAAQQFELSVSPLAIVLPLGDPDTMPVLVSAPVQLTYRVRGAGNRPWIITVLAGGDLVSGSSAVDISNVTWTATPAPPFQNGTLSRTVAQPLASGSGNVNPQGQAMLTFRLANSWSYIAGTYTQTVVFTLSSP
jgi:hypothetical protein